mgnify:CR=1 FL=1
MPDVRTTDLDAATDLTLADLMMMVDVSDTTMGAGGTNVKMTLGQLNTLLGKGALTGSQLVTYNSSTGVITVAVDDVQELIDTATAALTASDVDATPASHALESTTAHGGIVAYDDPRLSDDRDPNPHDHAIAGVTGLQSALDGKASTASVTAVADDLDEAIVSFGGALLEKADVIGGTVPLAQQGTGTPAAGHYVDGGTSAWTELPTLGTAAAADVGDFATAAQGALADTAVQPDEFDTDQGMPGLNRGGSALWKVEDGDLFMAAGGVSGGVVQSGALRGVQGLLIEPATYTQSAKPTDRLVGSPMTVLWNATIGESGGLGPEAQTTYFGPRPAVNLEGIVRYSRNQTSYGFSPVGFGDVLAVGNNAGAARTIVPSWPFMCARIYFADGATVTHGSNDVGDGGAAFVDAQILATQNGGTWDGVTNDSQLISFLSVPGAAGDVDLFGRIAFDVTDFTDPENPTSPGAVRAAMADILGGTIDTQAVSVVENVGLRVQPMSVGTHNIGVRNAAGLVEDPIALTVTASSTIPRNATLVHLTAASAVELNSTPIIGTGLPGQVIRLINVGSNYIRLLGELAGGGENGTAGTGIRNRVQLAAGESAELRWVEAEARWVPTYHSSPTVETTLGTVGIYSAQNRRYPEVSFGAFFGIPYMTLGLGGASTESVALTRTATNVLGVKSSVLAGVDGVIAAGHRQTVNAQTGTAYTVADADAAKTITRNNAGASTQDWPQDSAAPLLGVGTILRTYNRGAGAITHQAGAGATVLVTGTQGQHTWWTAQKIAANTWAVGPG